MPKQSLPKGFIRKTTFIRPSVNEVLKRFVAETTMSEYGVFDRALQEFFDRRPRITVTLETDPVEAADPQKEAIAPN